MPNILLPYGYEPRNYQLPLLDALDSGTKYASVVWHRRAGKDLACWNYAIKRAALQKMDVVYIYPTSEMAKDNLWEAKTNDGREFMDFIPMELRARNTITDDGLNNTFKQVTFINGSTIKLKSAEKPGRLRGGNPKLYVISEFAEMDPAVLDVIEPVVEANGGQILINFTPKGDNHAKGAMESWSRNPMWFTQIIKATDTKVFTPEQLVRIRQGLIDRYIQQGRSETEAIAFYEQEYLCSFETPVIGSYFGEGMRRADEEKRITNVPYDENLPVYTYWDLGIDDSMTVWFIQYVGKEIHLIDYLESSGEGMTFYIRELQKKKYVYGEHFAPHDIGARELMSGKERIVTARELGIRFNVVPRIGVEDRIDAGRMIIGRCWFDEDKCKRGISALKSFKKDWDDKLKKFKDHPKHDWASHGADAFTYFAVAYQPNIDNEPLPDDTQKYQGGFY